ncbi:MAG: 4-(cytidine 5'-diphospho)-2-C-methyl-D-erythritol kinase [Lentisphaerae bacterium GWF2_45_14]|nr:MAG: 4-(cytidine 5'-diphospho)-2-C-methyl-D-erythritol kinase [Lentisphaerae bacterium GWF2_45_14]
MRPAETKAPSKINLFLEVKGKRADGYHDIETVFMPLASPSDTIRISDASSGIVITSNDDSIPFDEKNLCWKAASKYAEAALINPAWSIHIEKNIPVAAGLGGGSSDAASVLLLLNGEYKLLSDERLAALALSIGADVPFFLNPQPSRACGVGEKIEPLGFVAPDIPLLILAPGFPVSAAWAYKNRLDSPRPGAEQIDKIITALKNRNWKELGDLIYNDLAPALHNKFPLLLMIKDKALESGACGAEISGSGPTLFAIYENNEALSSAREFLGGYFGPSLKII